MDIENHTTKDVCHLKYDAYNYFGRDTPRKVDKCSMYQLSVPLKLRSSEREKRKSSKFEHWYTPIPSCSKLVYAISWMKRSLFCQHLSAG